MARVNKPISVLNENYFLFSATLHNRRREWQGKVVESDGDDERRQWWVWWAVSFNWGCEGKEGRVRREGEVVMVMVMVEVSGFQHQHLR